MFFYTLVTIACVSSFLSALAIFSALVIAGRSEHTDTQEPVTKDLFPVFQVRANNFDEAALKRLADSI